MNNPNLCRHTNLQSAQANAQSQNYKRVYLINRRGKATLDGQVTAEKEGITHKTCFAKVAVTCFAETFMVKHFHITI